MKKHSLSSLMQQNIQIVKDHISFSNFKFSLVGIVKLESHCAGLKNIGNDGYHDF